MLAPKFVLGVQSGVNELCSTCAICATGFQNLCYLPFFTTLNQSLEGGWQKREKSNILATIQLLS